MLLQEILQKRENAETWNQKTGARVSEPVARNTERTMKLMQNKQLINRQINLMFHYKDVVKGWSGRTLHHTASQTNKSSTKTHSAKKSSTTEQAKLSIASGWTRVYGFPSRPRNKISMHGLGKKIITEARHIPLAKSRIKERWSLFDKRRVMDIEFVSEGKFVNSEFYVRVLERTLKRISRVRL